MNEQMASVEDGMQATACASLSLHVKITHFLCMYCHPICS